VIVIQRGIRHEATQDLRDKEKQGEPRLSPLRALSARERDEGQGLGEAGQSFMVEFERRGLHRKALSLPGSYRKPDSSDIGYGDILVEDLSRGGLAFRMVGLGKVNEGDVLDIQFQLDDSDRTAIRARIVVRHILNEKYGCQFVNLEPGIQKTLNFYLMP
jgi:hypothetical protein